MDEEEDDEEEDDKDDDDEVTEQVPLLWCWRNVGSFLEDRKHAVLSLQQRSCQKAITRDDSVDSGGGCAEDFVFL